MVHLSKYFEPVLHEFYLLEGLIPFINFQGADFLLGDDHPFDLRRQPLICYRFKMDWIRTRLVKAQRKIFRVQDFIIADGIVDDTTVDECLDLFATAFEVLGTTFDSIKNLECVCPTEFTEETRQAKVLEIEVEEAKVKHLLKHCKTSIFQFYSLSLIHI